MKLITLAGAGGWLASGLSVNSSLEELLPSDFSSVAQAKAADVDRAVESAVQAAPGWARMAAADRGRLLLRLADAIEADAENLAMLETRDTGHPIRDTRNLDVPRTAATFRYFGGMADKFQGSVVPVEADALRSVSERWHPEAAEAQEVVQY